MRTIGVKYKNMIKKIVDREFSKSIPANAYAVVETVKRELPVEAFDTWEMAYQEIERLANDRCVNHVFSRF